LSRQNNSRDPIPGTFNLSWLKGNMMFIRYIVLNVLMGINCYMMKLFINIFYITNNRVLNCCPKVHPWGLKTVGGSDRLPRVCSSFTVYDWQKYLFISSTKSCMKTLCVVVCSLLLVAQFSHNPLGLTANVWITDAVMY